MSNRLSQYESVAKLGVLGAVKEGYFALDGSGESAIPNPYVRQAIVHMQNYMGGGSEDDMVVFDGDTGLPVSVTPSNTYMHTYWRNTYHLPKDSPEGTEFVLKWHAPEYMAGAHAGYSYLSGGNWTSSEESPTGNSSVALYLDEACTQYLEWSIDGVGQHYFIMPEQVWLKVKAGVGGAEEWQGDGGTTPAGFSMIRFEINYASKDDLSLYQ